MALRFKIGNTEVVAGGVQVHGVGAMKIVAPAFFAVTGWWFSIMLILFICSLFGVGKVVAPNGHVIIALITMFFGCLFTLISVVWISYLRSTDGDPSAKGRFKNFRTNIYMGLAGYIILWLVLGVPVIAELSASGRTPTVSECTTETLRLTKPLSGHNAKTRGS